jgi:hypothetical protein
MFDNIPNEPLGVIKFMIGFGIVIYVVWLMTGGPERAEENLKPFIKEPAPLDSGETYGPDGLVNPTSTDL